VRAIVQPDEGIAPVVRAIGRARKSIAIFIFRLDRKEIEGALTAAAQRGVVVRALIANTNTGGEPNLRKLEHRLLAAGISVARTDDDLVRYHGKYMVADDALYVFGFNLTKVDIAKSRSFGIATRDRRTVKEALKIFESDSTRQPYSPARCNLVVSPETARDMLTRFIGEAKRELAIYDSNIQDPGMIEVLEASARKGVEIRVIGKLKREIEGVTIRRPASLRLHVRAIIRDGTRAFVGSQSLRKLELDKRREIGVLVNSPAVARRLLQVFETDWAPD
jgi:phosphatidylserine/phosphatidylglycerophosphate/cardiolipin synthase-like enzyme